MPGVEIISTAITHLVAADASCATGGSHRRGRHDDPAAVLLVGLAGVAAKRDRSR
jgi:MYXO-CTERM domain-containing protein